MHPDYEAYRLQRSEPRHPTNTLIPENLYMAAEALAGMEGDSVSALIVEGLARVIENRRGDPKFKARLEQSLAAQEEKLARLRTNPHLNGA